MRRHTPSGIWRASRGDTIVEVMISIVVIAAVLTGSFLVSRSSLKNVRDSEEHTQALNLLQGQMEQLRAAAGQSGTITKPTYTSGTSAVPGPKFCFGSGGFQANSCTLGSNNLYTAYIQSTGTDSNTGTTSFIGTVTWPSVNGNTDQEQLFYKVTVN